MSLPKDEELLQACTIGDLSLTRSLLWNGASIDCTEAASGDTPLHLACRFGHHLILEVLLVHPRVSPNLINSDGKTPCYLACEEGRAKMVALLLADRAVDVNKSRWQLGGPLHVSIRKGFKEIACQLLDHRSIDVNVRNGAGETVFMMACKEGLTEAVSMLLENPEVHTGCRKPYTGETAFNLACQKGQVAVVKLLLSHRRINVSKNTADEDTPLTAAIQAGQEEVTSLLLKDPRIDVNVCGRVGATPLCLAAHHGLLWAAQLILLHGRNVDTQKRSKSFRNRTASEIAHSGSVMGQLEKSEGDMKGKIAVWIDSFDIDPIATRQRLRELPGHRDPFISDTFALVVFMCDDLLRLRTADFGSPASRFFHIARRFPIELQMVLCNRMFGSSRNLITSKNSEPAFLKLGRQLAREDSTQEQS